MPAVPWRIAGIMIGTAIADRISLTRCGREIIHNILEAVILTISGLGTAVVV